MKWLLCENNKSDSKYHLGYQCHEEVLVDDSAVKAVCWKCVARMVPIETPKPKSGYPRGWKFMAEFVDTDGNVYHKGELQPELFGTKDPTPIKVAKKPERKKKGDSFDAKVLEEIQKRLDKKRSAKSKTPAKVEIEVSVDTKKTTKKTKSTASSADKWFAKEGEVSAPAKAKKVTRKTTTKKTASKPKPKKTTKTTTKTVSKKTAKKVTRKKTKK